MWSISPPKLVASTTSWPSYVVLACRPGTCFSSTPLSCGQQWSTLPIWHTGITAKQCNQLEAIQCSSLRTIFPDPSYCQALLHTRLLTLHNRRVNLCRTFTASSLVNTDLAHWFPTWCSDCHTYNLPNNHQCRLPRMTKRLENSPVNYIIKQFNKCQSHKSHEAILS